MCPPQLPPSAASRTCVAANSAQYVEPPQTRRHVFEYEVDSWFAIGSHYERHGPGVRGRNRLKGLEGIKRDVKVPAEWGNPRYERIGIAAMAFAVLLALISGATATAMVEGKLDSG